MAVSVASSLNSVIDSVRKLQLTPPVYIYSVESQETGISAADVDQHNLNLAYSPGHSCKIYLPMDKHSDEDLSGNIIDAWLKHRAARNLKNKEKEKKTENSSGSSQLRVFQHEADVTGLQFTPDSNLLLTCGLDGTVKAWSTSSFKLVESYNGISGAFSDIHVNSGCTSFVASLRLSGHYQACSSTAHLYSFENKYPVSTLRGHADDVECVRFHPNGIYIATASCDKTIKLWCTRTSKEVRNMQLKDFREGYPIKLAFSPDGKLLASAYCGSVKIWDLATEKILKCLDIPNPNILNICYSSCGNVLATGGSNKKLHLWNIKSDFSQSSDIKLETELLKCDNLDKTVFCIKNTSSFFSCLTA